MFKEELRTGMYIVHCRTKEQAKAFVDWAGMDNLYNNRWVKYWDAYQEQTYYRILGGKLICSGSLSWVDVLAEYPSFLSYEEALKPFTFKTGDKVIAFQKTAKGWEDNYFCEKTLYYIGTRTDSYDALHHVLGEYNHAPSGYYFAAEDFKLYEEEEKTEKELEKLQKQMDVLKETIKNEKATPKLNLSIRPITKALVISFGSDIIGSISDKGECYMVNMPNRRNAWESWIKSGMLVDLTPVTWRGKQYKLTIDAQLKGESFIYDFEYTAPCPVCIDDNINRYSNGTPILY